MSYSVKQGDIFGRIGSALGKGLQEQIPKEVEHQRLSQGLKKLGEESANLSPMEFLTKAYSTYGITPQMVQSLGEVARHQARGNALKSNQSLQEKRESPFPRPQPKNVGNLQEDNKAPSITTRPPIEAELNPYIPKTYDEIVEEAGRKFEENPALYNSNPELALNAAIQEDAQNQKINEALQTQGANERNVQNRIKSGLQEQNTRLGNLVPANVYDKIENEAINAVKSKKDGGRGLTEQEAQKEYGNKLDKISRDYQAIDTVGSWQMAARSADENKRTLKSVRKDFKERNDLENLADTYISKNKLSAPAAYYLAKPVSDVKPLNNAIVNLPRLVSNPRIKKEIIAGKNILMTPESQDKKTLEVSKKLAPLLGKEGSPLAVYAELKSRNYNPDIWLKYLDDNRKELGLTEEQGRELQKPINYFPNVYDLWLFYNSGLDKLVEQE